MPEEESHQPAFLDGDLEVAALVEAGFAHPIVGEAKRRPALLSLPQAGDGAEAAASFAGSAVEVYTSAALGLGVDRFADLGEGTWFSGESAV